jgi:Dehydratase family
VFENFEEMRAKVDSEDLQVDETSVLVLKGCGPRGYPGFPEVIDSACPPVFWHDLLSLFAAWVVGGHRLVTCRYPRKCFVKA